MKTYSYLVLTLLLFSCQTKKAAKDQSTTYKTTGSIERYSEVSNTLISEDSKIEILADEFTWSEGPLWIADGNYLLFSDIPPNRIMKWSEEEGISEYLNPSGYTGEAKRGGEPGSNGLLIDANGHLVLCQHGDRRIAKMTSPLNDPKPEFETIADAYNGMKFNSPNDATFDKNGNLYLTDPPYGLEKQMDDPAKETPFQGVYRVAKSGEVSLITDQLTRPNGIALSPDESTLYVANSDPDQPIWMAYTLNEEGQVLGEKLFYDASTHTGKGLPDGLRVDHSGNIWATGPGGVFVFDPQANLLAKIITGEATSNCAFDADQKTLYMTCDDYLMRIQL